MNTQKIKFGFVVSALTMVVLACAPVVSNAAEYTFTGGGDGF